MKHRPDPYPVDRLRQLIALDPATGNLRWLPRNQPTFDAAWAGKPALAYKLRNGYLVGAVERTPLLAHRVVYALQFGRWPDGHIDHINGKRDDNRPENLRVVTVAENARNRAVSTANRSGKTGVYWHSSDRRWCASIGIDGRRIHLGSFETFEDARAARTNAEIEYGYHPNHGRAAA